jgi:hypothetical protein
MPVFAQESADAVVGSVGLFDADGSVLYSVLLQSGADDLNSLTISSRVPENASYVDVFWTPESATFAGEENGVVTWLLDSLSADSVIGPFTYRVTFAEDTVIPFRASARVAWDEGDVSAETDDSELPLLSPRGSITVNQAGTDGIVQVGDTGVFMNVPANAYSEAVTFTFERQPIADDTPLPEVAEGTWWCFLFNVTVEPADSVAAEPILIFYPTRRTLTPDLPVFNFVQIPGGEWQPVELGAEKPASLGLRLKSRAMQAGSVHSGVVSPSGNQIIAILIGNVPAPTFHFTGGVRTSDRAAGITDGTSNTIVLPYIEQDNLITETGLPALHAFGR